MKHPWWEPIACGLALLVALPIGLVSVVGMVSEIWWFTTWLWRGSR